MAQSGKSQSRAWLWILLAIVVVVGGILYMRRRPVVDVRVARVSRQDLTSTIPTNGKVETDVDFQAHAPGPGTVAKLDVPPGEEVGAGQHLFRLVSSAAASRVSAAE